MLLYTPEDRLRMLNITSWEEEKLKLLSYQKSKQELDYMNQRIMANNPQFLEFSRLRKNGEIKPEQRKMLESWEEQTRINESHKEQYDSHLISGLNNLHHKYNKYKFEKENISPLDKKELQETLTNLRKIVSKQAEEEVNLRNVAIKNKMSMEEYHKRKEKIEKMVTPDQIRINYYKRKPYSKRRC